MIDQNPWVGSDMGIEARPVIENALLDNGIETRTGVSVAGVTRESVLLSSGEQIETATLIWCAGMRASSLTGQLPVARDRLGRVNVDDYLRVAGVAGVFAAGDVAAAQVDDDHLSVMSCQHGQPMGRYAGYDIVSELFDKPMLPLRIPWYVTFSTSDRRARCIQRAGNAR
jgi:NADH:quinone reductase (non-electrogenic)